MTSNQRAVETTGRRAAARSNRLAEEGLAVAIVVSIFSFGVCLVVTDGRFGIAIAMAGILAGYGIITGNGWAVAGAAISQATFGLAVAGDRTSAETIAITSFYTVVALLILFAGHLSFLGRRGTVFGPGPLRGYLVNSATVVTLGLFLSLASYLLTAGSAWPAWFFPISLGLVAVAIGLLAGLLRRNHHNLGAYRRHF